MGARSSAVRALDPGRGPRLRSHLALGLLLGLVLLLGLAVPAAAVQWYQHYEHGLELAGEGSWQEALAEFQAAAELERRPRAQVRTYGQQFIFGYDPAYHQARCLVELGRFEEAREQLAASEAAAVTPAAELAALRRRIEEGATADRPVPPPPPAAHLVVDSTPSGAQASVDGVPRGRTPGVRVEVAPGRHRVRLVAPGYEDWEEGVVAQPGETLRLDVGLRPRPPPADPVAATPLLPAPEEEPVSEPPPESRLASGSGSAPGLAAGSQGEEPAAPSSATAGGVEPEAPPSGPGVGLGGEAQDPPGAAASPAETGGPERQAEPAPGADGGDGSALRPGLLAGAGVLLLGILLVAGLWLRRRRRRAAAAEPGSMLLRRRDRRERIGPYRILGEIGRGGMATTYRARRRSDGAEVALKIPHETGDPTYLSRFLREGKLGETLHHPGIVRILEAGEDEGLPFLAMELIPGRTLKEEIESRPGGLPLEQALEIARSVAEALDYAHSKGVIHRDLKPENIMLLPGGGLKVMDFGVARIEGLPGLTSSRFFFGSPLYAAPEMVEPGASDRRSDLYSLGVLLFELLMGHPPFFSESVYRLLEMHRNQPLPEPGELPRPLPPPVWQVIQRLCAKQPEERYASAQELLVELNRLLHGTGEREKDPGGSRAVPAAGG